MPIELGAQLDGALGLGLVVHLHQDGQPQLAGLVVEPAQRVVVEGSHDQQRQVGAGGPALDQLVGADDEVLAQHRHVDGRAHGAQVVEAAAETALLGEHADRGGTASGVLGRRARRGRGCRRGRPCWGCAASPRRSRWSRARGSVASGRAAGRRRRARPAGRRAGPQPRARRGRAGRRRRCRRARTRRPPEGWQTGKVGRTECFTQAKGDPAVRSGSEPGPGCGVAQHGEAGDQDDGRDHGRHAHAVRQRGPWCLAIGAGPTEDRHDQDGNRDDQGQVAGCGFGEAQVGQVVDRAQPSAARAREAERGAGAETPAVGVVRVAQVQRERGQAEAADQERSGASIRSLRPEARVGRVPGLASRVRTRAGPASPSRRRARRRATTIATPT